MKRHLPPVKLFIAAVVLYSTVSYLRTFADIYSNPDKAGSRLIDFPRNEITMNIDGFEKKFNKAGLKLPASGFIGYSTDCYEDDHGRANESSPLVEIDYGCLAEIYAVQYTLAPLVLTRTVHPSINIPDIFKNSGK